MTGTIVKSCLGIAAVILVAFSSQQGHIQAALADISSQKTVQDTPFLKNATNWLNRVLLPEASGQAERAVGEVQQKASQQAQQAEQGAVSSVKKFIAQTLLHAVGVSPQDLVPLQSPCPAK